MMKTKCIGLNQQEMDSLMFITGGQTTVQTDDFLQHYSEFLGDMSNDIKEEYISFTKVA